MRPRTRYAKHDGVRIAYQVLGKGPVDLLVVPGFISHLDLSWAMPSVTAMFRRLASFSRLIIYDKAGTGISDPIGHVPTLEDRMGEVHAVLDAAGSERTALLGLSEGSLMSVLFAATYPERTRALALYGAFPCGSYDPELPADLQEPAERLTTEMFRVVEHWGEGWISNEKKSWNLGFFERAAATSAMARGMVEVAQQLDVRPALAAVQAPTVVVHRTGDPFPVGVARWMAGRIPGARFAELPGDMHPLWRGDMHAVVDEVESVVASAPVPPPPTRSFVTAVCVTGAGEEMLDQQVARFGGRRVPAGAGSALLAFHGPIRAIRCAHALVSAAAGLRAGVHAGELELPGEAPAGTAREVSERLMEGAGPGEVLVSSSARNLVAGSGLSFEDRGSGIYALATPEGVDLAPPRPQPDLARRSIDSLGAGERLRLLVARWAPGAGRAASRAVAALRARRG